MATKMILTGDVNLMNVTDPAVPFSLVKDEFRAADIVFCNLECCLYEPPGGHSVEHEGFYADPSIAGEALKSAGIQAVGIANNVNYGAAAITASIARLDRLGIAHTGAGANRTAARAPVILERDGVGSGFCSAARSIGRPTTRPATTAPASRSSAGIPPIRCRCTAAARRANRPGIPPEIVTWADPAYLRWLEEDIADLRERARRRRRVVPLGAARGGAALHDRDRPPGDRCGRRHGHRPWPALFAAGRGLQGKADLLWARQLLVPYRPWRQKHGDWLGMMVRVTWDRERIEKVAFQFVRHDDRNRTVPRAVGRRGSGVRRDRKAQRRIGRQACRCRATRS